jgi:HTH-type transcriptional regulator/antitoxin HigA
MDLTLTSKTYPKALARMEELLKQVGNETDPTSPEFQELDELSDQIADYEEHHFPFEPTNLKEMIELRMYQRKLKQKDLARLLGTSPSRISEILNGKRKLTFDLAKALHDKLNIDAELILKS